MYVASSSCFFDGLRLGALGMLTVESFRLEGAKVEAETGVRPLNRGKRIFKEGVGGFGLVSGSILTLTDETALPVLADAVLALVALVEGFATPRSVEEISLADAFPFDLAATASDFFVDAAGLVALWDRLAVGGGELSEVVSSEDSILTRLTGAGFLALRLLPKGRGAVASAAGCTDGSAVVSSALGRMVSDMDPESCRRPTFRFPSRVLS
jgi:hypothetical protein